MGKEKNKIIRVMHFPGQIHGGVGSVIMNIYRHIDREKIQFDFCVTNIIDCHFKEEIEKLGGRVFLIPEFKKHPFRCKKQVTSILKKYGDYAAVHIHSVLTGAPFLRMAKKASIKKRIFHSHNSNEKALERIPFSFLIKPILRYIIHTTATSRLACSLIAGKYSFKKDKFKVVNNAVDTTVFNTNLFCTADNSNYIDVINVARFVKEKNQSFILNLALRDREKQNSLRFHLVGDGEDFNLIQKKVVDLGLEQKVFLLGNVNNVERLYGSSDVFLLPSLFEGLPVTLIEAQSCGLPCVVSNTITNEANLGIAPYIELSLTDSIDKWIESIYALKNKRTTSQNLVNYRLSEKGYTIEKQCEMIIKEYC